MSFDNESSLTFTECFIHPRLTGSACQHILKHADFPSGSFILRYSKSSYHTNGNLVISIKLHNCTIIHIRIGSIESCKPIIKSLNHLQEHLLISLSTRNVDDNQSADIPLLIPICGHIPYFHWSHSAACSLLILENHGSFLLRPSTADESSQFIVVLSVVCHELIDGNNITWCNFRINLKRSADNLEQFYWRLENSNNNNNKLNEPPMSHNQNEHLDALIQSLMDMSIVDENGRVVELIQPIYRPEVLCDVIPNYLIYVQQTIDKHLYQHTIEFSRYTLDFEKIECLAKYKYEQIECPNKCWSSALAPYKFNALQITNEGGFNEYVDACFVSHPMKRREFKCILCSSKVLLNATNFFKVLPKYQIKTIVCFFDCESQFTSLVSEVQKHLQIDTYGCLHVTDNFRILKPATSNNESVCVNSTIFCGFYGWQEHETITNIDALLEFALILYENFITCNVLFASRIGTGRCCVLLILLRIIQEIKRFGYKRYYANAMR
ncbi:hypothetical protein GJ496_009473 [Pomphorhynchus laevis]|nr:hypothetical protein GJ496_009473 [Pomphorhynchus laevis]